MSVLEKIRSPLIVDPDQQFLGSLRSDPLAAATPPVTAHSGSDAQLLLSDETRSFSAIFVNPDTSTPRGGADGLSVIRFAHSHRIATPIYLLLDRPSPFGEKDLRSLGIHDQISKPTSYSVLLDKLLPAIRFDPSSALAAADPGRQHSIGTECSVADADFVAIRSADFVCGSQSFFDVYVRITADHYVKVLQAGDAFSRERIASYLSKGVTQFYIKREAQQHYLSYCDQLAGRILRTETVPIEVKLNQTLNHGEQTAKYLQSQGLSKESLKYAIGFIHNVESAVKLITPSHTDILRRFAADVVSYEHGVSTAMISALIARQLDLSSEQAIELVGVASLFHDIGLQEMPPEVLAENPDGMSPEQIELFHTHPGTGALILKSLKGIAPTVVQAVAQHHERNNRTGFPNRIGAGKVNRIAEIVGLSDELVHQITLALGGAIPDPWWVMEEGILSSFSQQAAEAFRKVFGKK